jgi:hypothetical protein
MITTDTVGRIVRLGAGAGFARDRIEPALDLTRHGNLDDLIFECLEHRLTMSSGIKWNAAEELERRRLTRTPLAGAHGTSFAGDHDSRTRTERTS